MDWKDWIKKHRWSVILGACVIVVFLLCVRLLSRNESEFDLPVLENVASQLETAEQLSDEEEDNSIYVDIKGAVKIPGVYKVNNQMRVLDVVDLAGGFTDKSDDKQINLAERLTDQMVIYVPEYGEEIDEQHIGVVTKAHPSESGATDQGDLININTATSADLQSLNGVGEKKAEKIVQYREEHGSFKTIEELKQVDGIGEKTFDSLKTQITI